MKKALHNIELLQGLDSNVTILTPNRRLAAALHKQYQQQQHQAEKKSWLTPDILPLTTWLTRSYKQCISDHFETFPLLLNDIQVQFLLEQIILSTKSSDQLLKVNETATLVKSAWSLLNQWQVEIEQPLFQTTEDYQALYQWITQFKLQCKKNDWIDHAQLAAIIIDQIQKNHLTLPKIIKLFGFNELSPQMQSLFSVLQQAGCSVHCINPLLSDSSHASWISLVNSDDEIITMARWAKAQFNHAPTNQIGCVIPSLEQKRDRVFQIFTEVFAEDGTYTIDLQKSPFNISAGKRLANYPIIHAALQFLSLSKPKLSLTTIHYLLTSPFLGEAESERLKRACFDQRLRQQNVNTISLTDLCDNPHYTSLSLSHHCSQLAKRLKNFQTHCLKQEKKSHKEWAFHFNELLSLLGWPGERSLNSEEYQVINNWLDLLQRYQSLDTISLPVSYQIALQRLQTIAYAQTFQPQTPDAPIQVLGMLEAAGLTFDALWVAGMDDLSWPQQPQPHPLIPKKLQRELKMPHATAERELHYSQSLITQLSALSSRIIFSYAENNEKLSLHISPLVSHAKPISVTNLVLAAYQSPSEMIYLQQKLEKLTDDIAPPVLMDKPLRGGINIIKQQALCPFKAFSEWRLHAHALERPIPGLRAKDRGTVVHKILERMGKHIPDHTSLVSRDDASLNKIIEQTIDETIQLFPHLYYATPHYVRLEKKRLTNLIMEWLQIEKEREDFKIIAQEKAVEMTLNQLTLSLRIDRIDELPNGKKLIIDYKTGKNNDPNHWFGDRPEEPQLPLYALLDSAETSGIAFAQISAGNHGFKGVSETALDIKGIRLVSEIKKTRALSWTEQLAIWQKTFYHLSEAFYQGIAIVDPKEAEQTCQWCTLQSFCRINEVEQHDC